MAATAPKAATAPTVKFLVRSSGHQPVQLISPQVCDRLLAAVRKAGLKWSRTVFFSQTLSRWVRLFDVDADELQVRALLRK